MIKYYTRRRSAKKYRRGYFLWIMEHTQSSTRKKEIYTQRLVYDMHESDSIHTCVMHDIRVFLRAFRSLLVAISPLKNKKKSRNKPKIFRPIIHYISIKTVCTGEKIFYNYLQHYYQK